jgi:hypothetical protein
MSLNTVFRDDYRTVNPDDLLTRAGRAVLIAPSGATVLEARSVLVAWKNTRETRRAMADANAIPEALRGREPCRSPRDG